MAPASSTEPPRGAPLILCAGIAVIDYIFGVGAMPKRDSKNKATSFTVSSGGNMGNAAIAIVRLGGRARLSAPLGGPAGTDVAGDTILRNLDRENVDHSAVIRLAGVHSSTSAILIEPGGERTIINYRDEALAAGRCENTAELVAILIEPGGERTIINYRDEALAAGRCENTAELVAGASAVLIDNRFPEFSLPIAQAAKKSGKVVVMDSDDPTRHTDALLNACSHVVFSSHGLRNTAQMQDFEQALAAVARRTPALLAVTDGANGLWWHDGDRVRRIAAHPVRAVDTLGAGDVFHGACVLALTEGRDFEGALAFSAAAAAVKCTRFGGIGGAPSRAEVEAFLAAADPLLK